MELGLRWFRPINYLRPLVGVPWGMLIHQPSPITGLSYELAPNIDTTWDKMIIRTNSHGMRDDEPIPGKNDSLLRIAVLGDSFAFGLRIPADEAFPQELEKRLNESTSNRSYHYDVLNFAVVGYSTREEALVLKHKALAWDPAVVIVGYVLNDPELDPIQPLHAYFGKPHWWQFSHLFRLIARVKYNWDGERLGGGNHVKYLHAEGEDKWIGVVDAFSDIKDMTSRRRIKVLVVIFPILKKELQEKTWNGWSDYPYKGLHKQVSHLATSNDFQVIDLYEAYFAYRPRDLFVSPWDGHPNRLGHDLAARAIAEKHLAEHSYFFKTKNQEPER